MPLPPHPCVTLASRVKPSRTSAFVPIQQLGVQHLDAARGLFRGASASVEVVALASDAIQIRIHPRRSPAEPSWIANPLPEFPPAIRWKQRRDRVHGSTDLARFELHLPTGAWSLSDPNGIEILSAVPGSIGFAGAEARITLRLAPREALFGLGETTGAFNKRGQIKEFWNTDVLGHAPAIHPALKSLYVSIPFAISLRDGRVAGLFWDNPSRQVWDLGNADPDAWQMQAASGAIDLYCFTGPRISQVLDRFTQLTGRMPLPPRWALGYHQSRYSYKSHKHLESIAREFRRREIPCDALYCDIHHMDHHRVFTFGRDFPRPRSMIARLRRQGFQVVAIANPGVQDSRSFGLLRRGRKADAFVQDATGKSDFIGEVWPGKSRFPDFLSAAVRDWWGQEQTALLETGVAGVWNDMNEPANFARPDKTLDPEAIHRTDRGRRRHHEVHNLYGMQMARASRDGMLRFFAETCKPDAIPRPFVITRSGYAGVQRHAIVWTGDNSACWEHLADSLQMLLNLSLSGVPFVGSDVGGFLGNPTPELFIRWLQMAVFTPFLRTHSNIDTRPREPWSFGPEVESIARDFLRLRYQLLPYLYGLVHESSESGIPIVRPLFWHAPNDPLAVGCSDQFFLGENLLIAPILQPGTRARSVYLPRGEWYDFWSGDLLPGSGHILREAPLDRIPILVRSGTILPMCAPQASLASHAPEVIFLHVWPRDSGSLTWYDDDGLTQAYATGASQSRVIQTRVGPRSGLLDIGPIEGEYAGHSRRWRIVLRGIRRKLEVRVQGVTVPAEFVPELGIQAFDVPTIPGPIQATWR